MAEFNEKEPVVTDFDTKAPHNETPVDESTLPHINDLSEEEIAGILREDAADIEPPESLSPRAIEERLIGVQQETKKRTSPIFLIAGMAACLVLGIMAGFLTFSLIRSAKDGGSNNGPETVANAGGNDEGSAVTFSGTEYDELSYLDVCSIINRYNENNQRYYEIDDDIIYEEATEDAAPAAEGETGGVNGSSDIGGRGDISKTENSGGSTHGTSDYSRTDTQVEGVDEGDIVRTDGRYIYTIESSTFGFTIHVIQPNGNQSKEIGSIEIPNANISEMYVSQNTLITIGTEWVSSKPTTSINFVDVANATSPRITHTLTQTGSFNTSRLSGGYLYTFSEDNYYSMDRFRLDEPRDYIPQINDELIPSTRLVRAGEDDTNNYMVMTSVPVEGADDFTDTLAVLGGGATYYVSTDHIYLSRDSENSGNNWYSWDMSITPTTALTKFTYEDGRFAKNAATTFRGRINNSYYMHEYKGNFCFVYTSNNSSGESTNGLCVLDENLNKLGELRSIATGETIYSSYFIDNMAYFVTYRNTDPVFAVDLSDPTRPALKSELKLPGFSSYLHSFGADKLIGIGYGSAEDEGWDATTKLSLFGIGKNYEITELTKSFADRYARNIADQNHKAIFVDENRMIVGMGLWRNDYIEDEGYENVQYYVAYQLKGDKFVKVLDTSRDKTIGNLNMTDSRGIRIGDIFYVCNPTGVVRAYTISNDGSNWKEA